MMSVKSLLTVGLLGILLSLNPAQAVEVDVSGEGTATQVHRRVYTSPQVPAAGDVVGSIPTSSATSAGGSSTVYSQVSTIIDSPTANAQSGRLRVSAIGNGVLQNIADFTPTGLYLNTLLGIGTTNPTAKLDVAVTGSTDNGEVSGIKSTVHNTGAGCNDIYGVKSSVSNGSGYANNIYGVYGEANPDSGDAEGTVVGVFGKSDYGSGVTGQSTGGYGISGISTNGYGASAYSTYGVGLSAYGATGLSVSGSSYAISSSSGINYFGGNVGIGITAPATMLDVRGTGMSDGALRAQQIVGNTSAYNASPLAGIDFYTKYNASGTYAGMGGVGVGKENTTDGNYASYLALYNRAHGSGITDRLHITSTGNVGIGTTAPAYKLDVNGTAQVGSLISTGSVGIGTTAPGVPLHIENSAVNNNLQDQIRLQVNNTGGGGSAIQFRNKWDSSVYWTPARIAGLMQGSYGGQLAFYTHDNVGVADDTTLERMRIIANGNVGINTTAPGYKLDVNGSMRVANAGMIIENNNNGGAGSGGQLTVRGTSDNTKKLILGYDTTAGYGSVQAYQSGAVRSLFLQPDGGFVGIGTNATYPAIRKLHALSTAQDITARVENRSNSLNGWGMEIVAGPHSLGRGYPYNEDTHFLQFYTPDVGGLGEVVVGAIMANQDSMDLYRISDIRTKTNITKSGMNDEDIINRIQVIEYNSLLAAKSAASTTDTTASTHKTVGFSAQNLAEVYPAAVARTRSGQHGTTATGSGDDLLMVSFSNLVPLLIKNAQTRSQQVSQLEAQTAELTEQMQTVSPELESSIASGTNKSKTGGNVTTSDTIATLLPDFSQSQVLDKTGAHKPQALTAEQLAGKQWSKQFTGPTEAAVDPASLPIEVTNYLKLLTAWTNNTDATWVAKHCPLYTKGSGWNKRSTAEIQSYIKAYRQTHKNPDEMTPEELGVSVERLATWNYQAIYDLLQRLQAVEQKINPGITTSTTALAVPDYVFEAGYDRMSLEELKQYVKTNKHLPGVPSRKDIERGGLDRDVMLMKVLEKVEELVLYSIDQNESVAQLKKENQQQQTQIDQLHDQLAKQNDQLAKQESTFNDQIKALQAQMQALSVRQPVAEPQSFAK
jgi:hypothetical protein